MKSSSISVSNAQLLGLKEWFATIAIVLAVAGTVYYGWGSWERFAPGPDHRETCWAELQSDYWAWMRWSKVARETHDVLLVGDSVIWGQEVPNTETISHYLNEYLGGDIVANLGNDGLFMAGINGIVKHYGDYLGDTSIILQCSPLWMASPRRDLRSEKKSQYHHPRLIPQFDPRINYYHDFNTRLGYRIEHTVRFFPFVRHLTANYFDNKSIAGWMVDNPYSCPASAVTFRAAPVMAESQGRGISWLEKDMKQSDDPFVDPGESVQFGLFLDAVELLKAKNSRVFIMIGPYNHHYHTPESRERLFAMIEDIKTVFDERGYEYFDTFTLDLPGDTFGDSCHLLREGHDLLARGMAADDGFRAWIAGR